MSELPDDSPVNLTQAQKGAFAYRAITLALTAACSGIGMTILGYVKAASSQLDQQGKDIALIKWEIPAIKQTQVTDKTQIQNQILGLEDRLKETRLSLEHNQSEISEIKIQQALIRERRHETNQE